MLQVPAFKPRMFAPSLDKLPVKLFTRMLKFLADFVLWFQFDEHEHLIQIVFKLQEYE